MTLNLLKEPGIFPQDIYGLLDFLVHFHVLPKHAILHYQVNVRLIEWLAAKLQLRPASPKTRPFLHNGGISLH